jgi:hypothetical protein
MRVPRATTSNSLIRKVEMDGMVKLGKLSVGAAAMSLGVRSTAVFNHRKRNTSAKYVDAIKQGFNPNRERLRFGKHHNMEVKLLEWIAKAQNVLKDSHITLSSSIIRFKAADIAREMLITGFCASNGWWEKFSQRWLIQRHIFHGEAASVNKEAAAPRLREIAEKLTGAAPDHIFNMDETGLLYRSVRARNSFQNILY